MCSRSVKNKFSDTLHGDVILAVARRVLMIGFATRFWDRQLAGSSVPAIDAPESSPRRVDRQTSAANLHQLAFCLLCAVSAAIQWQIRGHSIRLPNRRDHGQRGYWPVLLRGLLVCCLPK
jgi:hypothetical protein